MTESIKQEIINNIFENGDKLITGPILQTVLIDMIDDVNVKDQAILSKTGSWDEAVTQIPNLATKEEVTNLSESVARDLENVVDVDLTGYATEQWVQNQGYLKEHQDISGLATKSELTEAENNLQGNITSLSESVARDLANVDVDLTGYATEQWVESKGYLTEHQDISNLATKTELNSVSESIQTDISGLATKVELNDTKNNLQGNITNLSESVANSAVWKKGTAQNSIVQVIADGKDQPTATGERAIATGLNTNASGPYSHAEGSGSNASGQSSHAEGNYTTASGSWSHAEGDSTRAEGNASHAEGTMTNAGGEYSHAEGQQTFASGDYSHAEGYGTFALSSYSHAEGQQTQVPGWGSHAEGQFTKASGSCSHAEGFVTNALGDYSHAEGAHTTASGEASHAEGRYTTASGAFSHAEGHYTNASGAYSHTEGRYTTASGLYSHAEGDNTNASQAFSHTEGGSTIASGWGSHAEGNYTTASGHCSHAEGSGSNASQAWSHTEGRATVTSNEYEHAQGRYNYTSSNQIFSIGTGNSDTDRRNAVSVLEVDNSGSYTSSFFVQNIGGYDGTNPTPGTNDLATVINGLSSGGGSSETLWKNGEGENSVVQVSSPREEECPTAIGPGAVAIGAQTEASNWYSHAEGYCTTASGEFSHAEGADTIASGQASHAEGQSTTASSDGSHAEGDHTEASGYFSHAEGTGTIASNDSEHAQGMFNHSSENQIFSVGAGDGNPSDPSTATRRNAISVLSVPNSETQITTASVFVQNIGGYNGTNPIPGTNDLATVINGMAIEGGIGTSSETWTFTLEDGSTVTKNIVMR